MLEMSFRFPHFMQYDIASIDFAISYTAMPLCLFCYFWREIAQTRRA